MSRVNNFFRWRCENSKKIEPERSTQKKWLFRNAAWKSASFLPRSIADASASLASCHIRYRKEEKKKRFRKMGQEEARKKSKESSAKD